MSDRAVCGWLAQTEVWRGRSFQISRTNSGSSRDVPLRFSYARTRVRILDGYRAKFEPWDRRCRGIYAPAAALACGGGSVHGVAGYDDSEYGGADDREGA